MWLAENSKKTFHHNELLEAHKLVLQHLLSEMLLRVVAAVVCGTASAWTVSIAVMGRVRGRFLPNNRFGSMAEPDDVSSEDGSATGSAVYGGPARIAGVVEDLRASGNVLFVDLGGFYYTDLWYRYDVLDTAEQIYDAMDVDVAACDNWDFYSCAQTCAVYGDWVERLGRLGTTTVGANLNATKNPYLRGGVVPWTVRVIGDGVEVGIIGLVDTDIVERIGGALAPDVSARTGRVWSDDPEPDGDDVATAIAELEENHPRCEIIVLIVGELNFDGGTVFYEYMYDAYPSLDVIVSYEPWVGVDDPGLFVAADQRKVAYVRSGLASQATASASAMAVATIDFDDATFDLVNATTEQLSLGEGSPLSSEVWAIVVESLDGAYAALLDVVGYSEIFLDGERSLGESATGPQPRGCYRPDCSLGRVAALADLELCGDCDFALENGGVVRESINAGNVTAGDVRTSFIFDNDLISVHLTGDAVRELLEHAVTQIFDFQQCDQLIPQACGGPDQLECVEGACELHGGIPQFAGLRWAFNAPFDTLISAEIYDRQDDAWYDLDAERTYKVATNSFIFDGGNGYDVFAEQGSNSETLRVGQVETILEFVRTYSPLSQNQAAAGIENGQPIFQGGVGDFAKCGAFETTDGYTPVALPVRASACTSISTNVTEYRDPPQDVTLVVAEDKKNVAKNRSSLDDVVVVSAVQQAVAEAQATLFPYTEICTITGVSLTASEEDSSVSLEAQLEAAIAGLDATCPSGRRTLGKAPLAWVVNVEEIPDSAIASIDELDADFGLLGVVPAVDTTLDSAETCFLAPDAEDALIGLNAVIDDLAWTSVLVLYTVPYVAHLDIFRSRAKAGLRVESALLDYSSSGDDNRLALGAIQALEGYVDIFVVVVAAGVGEVSAILDAVSEDGRYLAGYAYLTFRLEESLDFQGALVVHDQHDVEAYFADATTHAAEAVSSLISAYRNFQVGGGPNDDDPSASFHQLEDVTTLLRREAQGVSFSSGRTGDFEMVSLATCPTCCQRRTSLSVSSIVEPGTSEVVGEWTRDLSFDLDDVPIWPGNVTKVPGLAGDSSSGSSSGMTVRRRLSVALLLAFVGALVVVALVFSIRIRLLHLEYEKKIHLIHDSNVDIYEVIDDFVPPSGGASSSPKSVGEYSLCSSEYSELCHPDEPSVDSNLVIHISDASREELSALGTSAVDTSTVGRAARAADAADAASSASSGGDVVAAVVPANGGSERKKIYRKKKKKKKKNKGTDHVACPLPMDLPQSPRPSFGGPSDHADHPHREPQALPLRVGMLVRAIDRFESETTGEVWYYGDVILGGEADRSADSATEQSDGWFPARCVKKAASQLVAASGREDAVLELLQPPPSWAHMDDVKDVELVEASDDEFQAVSDYFNQSIHVLSVQRVQNLSLWQCFVVKRAVVLQREGYDKHSSPKKTKKKKKTTSQSSSSSSLCDGALDADGTYEVFPVFHGTSGDVVKNIAQQGFNRSFCGKNAVRLGKGVYFVRISYLFWPWPWLWLPSFPPSCLRSLLFASFGRRSNSNSVLPLFKKNCSSLARRRRIRTTRPCRSTRPPTTATRSTSSCAV
mmetsp:Transcript_7027/g.22960  ORF Transcript_7027/g.22960 Transcript_7027/m.22960 type:complete len:1583 (+) Transcript_7027:1431-6179(+)